MARIFGTGVYFRRLTALTRWHRKRGRVPSRDDSEIVRLTSKIVRRAFLESTSLSTTLVIKPPAPLMRIPIMPGPGTSVQIRIPPGNFAQSVRPVSIEQVVGLIVPELLRRAEAIDKTTQSMPYDSPGMGELKRQYDFLMTLHGALSSTLELSKAQ